MSDTLTGLGDVLSGADWSAAQYVPEHAVADTFADDAGDDPKKKKPAAATVPAADRILTGEEWATAQRKSADEFKTWQVPRVPKLPTMAPRDATRTPIDRATEPKGYMLGEGDPGVHGFLLRQVVRPALEHPGETVAITAAQAIPVLGQLVDAGLLTYGASQIAQYGYQKYLASDLSPEARKEFEADPEYVSGEAAAAQALFLGLGAAIHAGVKGVRRARTGLDYGAGMTEAGVRGLDDLHTTQEASPTRIAASEYEARRLAEDTKDLETHRKTMAAELAGDVPDQPAAPFTRVTRAEAYRTAADDYQARRLAEDRADLADTRAAEAERVAQASVIRRRPSDLVPFVQSEQGAEVLGLLAGRRGLSDDASPYPPDTPNDVAWKSGHASATESYPEGFSIGGPSRIPAASEIPKRARGSDVVPPEIPEGVTPETIALANALKPSRYRGHSTDDLVEAAIDARARLNQAQADEFHYAEGQISTPEHQARVENNQEAEVYYAKRREMETSRAKGELGKIERELALRGLHGDALAERIAGAQVARAERQAMQEEGSLALLTGKEPPAGFDPFDPFSDASSAPSGTTGGTGSTASAPVAGTGETRTRGLAAAIERKAIANKLTTALGDLPQYQRVSMTEQADLAAALLARDPALARRVALGDAPAPDGLLPESVLVAVERQAVAEGDVAMLRDLATGRLGEDITHMGQRIRALAERDPDSPVGAIQSVVDARTAAGNKVPRATEEVVAAIRAKLSETSVSAEKLAEFLKSLEC